MTELVHAWTANTNGDDLPHVTGRHDIIGVQEAGNLSRITKLRHLFSRAVVITPRNGQYHLAVVLKRRVFKVEGTHMVPVHPSGADMHRNPKWNVFGRAFPVDHVPTPPRGFFVLRGTWRASGRAGFIIVGHRINIGPDQKVRDVLARRFDDTLEEYLATLATEDRAGVGLFDYNTHHPSEHLGFDWVANNGPDHIGATGMTHVGHQRTGGVAGHSGRVHHRSLGITLRVTKEES